jgi:hypothetical protein
VRKIASAHDSVCSYSIRSLGSCFPYVYSLQHLAASKADSSKDIYLLHFALTSASVVLNCGQSLIINHVRCALPTSPQLEELGLKEELYLKTPLHCPSCYAPMEHCSHDCVGRYTTSGIQGRRSESFRHVRLALPNCIR